MTSAYDCDRHLMLPTVPLINDGFSEANQALNMLNIALAAGPVMAGNQLNINAESCPDAKIAGVVFEQHYHYETDAKPSSSEAEANISNQSILKEIIHTLKKHYSTKEAWLTPFEWMRTQKLNPEDYWIDLEIVKLSRSNRFIKQETLVLENIFEAETVSTLPPQSILVHGEPGIGKTTVCVKLIYDWATKVDGFLSDYELVIFIPFRALDSDFDDFIVDICCKAVRTEPPEPTIVRKILKALGSKLLLVLDSLEELPYNIEDSFTRLLTFDRSRQQSLLNQATVFVTTRPNPPMEFIEVFNRHVRINGFSYQHQSKYVYNYFISEPEKSLILDKQLSVGTYRGLGACPLMLYILCYLHDVGDVVLKSTRATDVFYTVTSLLISRSANRERDDQGACFQERDLEHFLVLFGHLCCNCLKDGRLYVTEGEILLIFPTDAEQRVLKGSGILKLTTYPQKFTRMYFEPSHRSFFEFLAAKSFKFELSKAMAQEKRFSILKANDRLITSNNTQVLIFLCGMVKTNEDNELFNLDYFEQNEQNLSSNDPLLSIKGVEKKKPAFSVVTSSMFINELTREDNLKSVLALTKPCDNTPNFNNCPPFFYEGFKKFLKLNSNGIRVIRYDIGIGDFTMELDALSHAPKICTLMLNLVVPFHVKQLGGNAASPMKFFKGILELPNVVSLKVSLKPFWFESFIEEVDDRYQLKSIECLSFRGGVPWDIFLKIMEWCDRYLERSAKTRVEMSFVNCKVTDIVKLCFQDFKSDRLRKLTINFCTSGCEFTLIRNDDGIGILWKTEEDDRLEEYVMDLAEAELKAQSELEELCVGDESLIDFILFNNNQAYWVISFWIGVALTEPRKQVVFEDCSRVIQLENQPLEWRGDNIQVFSKSDDRWFDQTIDHQNNLISW